MEMGGVGRGESVSAQREAKREEAVLNGPVGM